jgi:hypothetical protein
MVSFLRVENLLLQTKLRYDDVELALVYRMRTYSITKSQMQFLFIENNFKTLTSSTSRSTSQQPGSRPHQASPTRKLYKAKRGLLVGTDL